MSHAGALPEPQLLAAAAANREISRLNDAIEKVVVSDGLTEGETDPWRETTRIARRADAHQRIAELTRGPGRDVLMFAGRTRWHDLPAAGLVDELHLMVGSVVIGGGTPAFATPPAAPPRLLGTRTWDGSDNVLVRYVAAPVS